MVELAEEAEAKSGANSIAQDVDRHVGERMRERRLMLGLTQHQMAEPIGVTKQEVHHFEKGIGLAPGRLYQIAQALGVDVGYFFEGLLSGDNPSKATQRKMLGWSRALAVHPDEAADVAEDLAVADLHEQNTALRTEFDEVQSVISAALLAATAFRLRDQDGLASALRLLVRAIQRLEGSQSPQTNVAAPVKFLVKLMDTWAIGNKETAILLGLENANDLMDLISDTTSLDTRDVKDRVRHLLRMRQALHSLFRDIDTEREWLREPRSELNDQSPLDLLLEGSMENFLVLSQFVQRMAGR